MVKRLRQVGEFVIGAGFQLDIELPVSHRFSCKLQILKRPDNITDQQISDKQSRHQGDEEVAENQVKRIEVHVAQALQGHKGYDRAAVFRTDPNGDLDCDIVVGPVGIGPGFVNDFTVAQRQGQIG